MPEEVKAERYERLMQRQQAISAELLASPGRQDYRGIVDEVDEEGAIGRSCWDAPEIDGNVYLTTNLALKPGDRLMVTVEDSNEYDLWASPCGLDNGAI